MKELDSFTVERLGEIKNAFLDCHKETAPIIGEIFALIDIALAAKRAEPIGYVAPEALRYKNFDNVIMIEKASGRRSMPLYTTPQLNSPEIPEGWPTEDMAIAGFESEAWDELSSAVLKRQGWPYSCRESAECVTGIFKAMLAAAPEPQNQQQNIPEIIPKGWIKCSDRMPENDERKPIAIYTGNCLGQGMFVASYDDNEFSDYWEGTEIDGVTHWMPLPTAPEKP
ncbi:DUF551 domain-containing protein [Yersinia enterocolitica]